VHTKDFEGWNKKKQSIELTCDGPDLVLQGDIWWCSLGVNIGAELDGKNDTFERPVLILKHINRHTVLIAPCTSTSSGYRYLFRIKTYKKEFFINLAQIRVISKKRLFRRVDIIDDNQFLLLQKALIEFVS
jgi:mRNA interferase MazF